MTPSMPRYGSRDERIAYVVHHKPGGCDGLDNTAKGGPMEAFWSRDEAEKKIGRDSRYEIKPEIVEVNAARREAIKKLSPVDRLVLEIK